MKTKAAILFEQKAPLAIEEIEIPALRFGQVLVKVHCSGICGSQIGEIDGAKGPDKFLPHLLGHEASATVLECGEGVTTVKADDHVVLHWRPGLGIQAPSPQYGSPTRGTVNAGWIATFCEKAVISENRMTRVPDELNHEIAALMGCAVTTGLGVINNNAKVKIGQSVVVWGAGGIGLNIVQGADLVSAYPVVAIDLYDHKLELARGMGATHTINAGTEDVEQRLHDLFNATGADVVVDNTGVPGIIESCYRWTHSSGKTILVGVPKAGNAATLYTLPLHFEKEITGSHGGETVPHVDIPNYVKLVGEGVLDLDPLVTQRFGLEEINEAIQGMRKGSFAGRCMIHMPKD